MILADAEARKLAIDPTDSFAVIAPAGSGKTELLIQRTLSLLSKVEQPEAILGITFTRKAANEMRERIIRALCLAKADEPVDSAHAKLTREMALAVLERDKELGWRLLNNPSRLRFQTIDGLCRQLANQLCLETGVVIPPHMTEDPRSLYQQAAEKLIAHLDQDTAFGESLRILVRHLDGRLDNLVNLISELLASRDSWLPVIFSGEVDPNYLNSRIMELVEEELGKSLDALAPYTTELEGLLAYACQHKEGASWLNDFLDEHIPEISQSQLPQWKALRGFLLSGKYADANIRSGKAVNKSLGFPTTSELFDKTEVQAHKARMQAFLDELREDESFLAAINRIAILPELEQDQASQINQALFSLLPVAAAELDLLAQEIGETDYTAVAMAAIDSLGTPDQPTPLSLRLDYRLEHILVDEFQDTSGMQIELLERLTAGWQGSEEDGRTLFIVGDGMQSIYGFRKANVSLFIRARQQGIGQVRLRPLNLSANFRSDSQIVGWVNQCFASVFPKEDNLIQGQVAFRQAEVTRESSQWSVDMQGFATELLEAEAIAKDIANKKQKGEDDIAMLVRGRNHLREILPVLRAHKISWQAQDIDPLAGRMAVMDIHSITRAVCVPADRIAWLSILRAPWAGLSMADLLVVAGKNDQDDFDPVWNSLQAWEQFTDLSAKGKNTCSRLALAFESAFAQLGQHRLRDIVEQLWSELDADKALLEPRDLTDIGDYLDLLEKYENGGLITDWPRFERGLSELYAQPDQQDPGEKPLQIMTIHKSKGLEFDHVYLPALGRATGTNTEPLMLWWQREFENGSEAYLIAAKPDVRNDSCDGLFDYLRAEEAARELQENARILYVAATRARKSLFMTAVLKWHEEKQTIVSPASKSLLSVLWPAFEGSFIRDFEPSEQADENNVGSLTGIRRLLPDRDIKTQLVHSEDSTNNAINQTQVQSSQNYQARICGDLIHQTLMQIVRRKISHPEPSAFVPDWQKSLANKGLDKDSQEQCLQKLKHMLEAVLNDDKARWILDFRHKDSAAELEIDYLDKRGAIQLAIIDRTFVEQDSAEGDIRWIIDYKSSSPEQGQTTDAFFQQEIERYRAQLARYASLFSERTKTMLYFPAIARTLEVDIG